LGLVAVSEPREATSIARAADQMPIPRELWVCGIMVPCSGNPNKRKGDPVKTTIPVLTVVLLVSLSATPCALAGPNAGGVLVVHNTGLLWSANEPPPLPPNTVPPASCSEVNNTATPGDHIVWKIYAVFPPSSTPRLASIAFGVAINKPADSGIDIQGWGLANAGDWEVTDVLWPNGGGLGEAFTAGLRTSTINDLYWFGGYGYLGSGGETPTFCTGHWNGSNADIFVSDGVPALEDDIAGFGCLGFGVAGYTPWPQQFLDSFGSSGSGAGQFSNAWGIATSDDGFVYVADTYNHRVQKFTATGDFVSSFGSLGTGPGQFQRPYGIDVDAAGNVYVGDLIRADIQKFSSDSTYLGAFGHGVLTEPRGLWVSDEGIVYVTDRPAKVVRRFTTDGAMLPAIGPSLGAVQLAAPQNIEGDGQGTLYVSDGYPAEQVRVLTTDGAYVASFACPSGDPSGAALAQGLMFLTEYSMNLVSGVDPGTGAEMLTIAPGGGTGLLSPIDCAASGDSLLYVLDKGNNRVLRFRLVGCGAASAAPDGMITELALDPPTPNPTVGDCRIAYALSQTSRVRLSVFDVQGREIAVLMDGTQSAGRHEQRWAGSAGGTRLASGLYFVRLRVDGQSELRQRIVVMH
jgi:DNA-binding beta-propeller fold protein YncE